MTTDERLAADYSGSGLTCGPHPMTYRRPELKRAGFLSADDLARCTNNRFVQIAGCVIARQRPGTAKGFVFLSLEDEFGIANVIITPDLFERERVVVTRNHFLAIEGALQIQNGVVHIKAHRIRPMDISTADVRSHDFH
jgi:error-prone DNA polymerase